MNRQADRLSRIGLEGFAAIDEHFGRAKRRPPAPKVPYIPQTNPIPATKVIDSSEAAQRYNGKVYINYPRGKPVLF
ncbi:hypothetical protein OIU77_015031 [Salix suchowensis]|uniref:Uncharacterized protein n=1 Tax=Salix suchowensis TaxID=1278906 RepID=A0ABQ8ZZA0_9ROSI|nr:hypothetical protein IMY05_010G0006300 [Salix suchowensis]KAJ6313662.1 hypothetical protein OIU77_015031 [Salix suchowensis]